ncbi:MAG: hypothetical protein ACRERV_00705 [Methylococcales bacterium]
MKSQLQPGYMRLFGHVVDVATGEPLAGVRVHAGDAGVDATTDAQGYFSLHVPVSASPDQPDSEADLTAEATGYQTYVLRNSLIWEGGDTHFIIDMEPGRGTREQNIRHKLKGGVDTAGSSSIGTASRALKTAYRGGTRMDKRTWQGVPARHGGACAGDPAPGRYPPEQDQGWQQLPDSQNVLDRTGV